MSSKVLHPRPPVDATFSVHHELQSFVQGAPLSTRYLSLVMCDQPSHFDKALSDHDTQFL